MDTTFFGREFGVLVLMDSFSEKVIYHQIVSTERDEYYQLALNSIRDNNYVIQPVTCDGRRGLLKDLLNTPTQILVRKFKENNKNEFYRNLHYGYLKHQDYLNERS